MPYLTAYTPTYGGQAPDPVIVSPIPVEPPPAPGTTSNYPVTVDGVRLDNLAWNILQIHRAMPARRARQAIISGVNGVVPSLIEDYEIGTYGLTMFVRGTDTQGNVPASGSVQTYRRNLDELLHLFGKGFGLLELRETIAPGVERQAYAQVQDVIEPSYDVGASGQFRVSFTIPEAFWQDINEGDWTQDPVVAGTAYEISTLTGATAPITDSILIHGGPALNPRFSDAYSGAYVTYDGALAPTAVWRVNCRTWSSRVGTGLGLGSSDLTGTDVAGRTRHGGGGAPFLTLYPVRDAGQRRVRIRVAGTGLTAATRIQVRARRKYLG